MAEKPITGMWTLTDPNGREYKAESPLHCCRKEQEERLPIKEQLRRLEDRNSIITLPLLREFNKTDFEFM